MRSPLSFPAPPWKATNHLSRGQILFPGTRRLQLLFNPLLLIGFRLVIRSGFYILRVRRDYQKQLRIRTEVFFWSISNTSPFITMLSRAKGAFGIQQRVG